MRSLNARAVIWAPDEYELAEVAEAALEVLERPGSSSLDAHQAAHLLVTMRPLAGGGWEPDHA